MIGKADRSGLLAKGAPDALLDPEGSIGGELSPFAWIEALHSFDQSNIILSRENR
jgi:hypothetical protein